jgi:hypothetical protein
MGIKCTFIENFFDKGQDDAGERCGLWSLFRITMELPQEIRMLKHALHFPFSFDTKAWSPWRMNTKRMQKDKADVEKFGFGSICFHPLQK